MIKQNLDIDCNQFIKMPNINLHFLQEKIRTYFLKNFILHKAR